MEPTKNLTRDINTLKRIFGHDIRVSVVVREDKAKITWLDFLEPTPQPTKDTEKPDYCG